MSAGRLVLGLDLLATGARVTHPVEHDEIEPSAPIDMQPAFHQVDLLQASFELRALYGLTEAWALELSLPIGGVLTDAEFFDGNDGLLAGFDSIHHRDETIGGVGDMQIAGRWVAPFEAVSFELRFGVSLPFGEVVDDPYALGHAGLEHRHQFLGSGTLDPVMGVDASYALSEDWDLSAWSSARVPLYAGPKGYRSSRSVSGGLGVGLVALEGWRFQLGPEARWESTAEWSGRTAENSGRTELMVSGGVFHRLGTHVETFLVVKVPVWLDAVGEQVTQPAIGAAGVRWAVDL